MDTDKMIGKSALLDALFEVNDTKVSLRIKRLLDHAETSPTWREDFKTILVDDNTVARIGDVGVNALAVVVSNIKEMEEMERLQAEEEARWPTPVYVPEVVDEPKKRKAVSSPTKDANVRPTYLKGRKKVKVEKKEDGFVELS